MELFGRCMISFYKDNGIGMKTYMLMERIENTVSRIKSLGGDIIFVSEAGKGLKIKISILTA
jgi:signal transduction histidine kinase